MGRLCEVSNPIEYIGHPIWGTAKVGISVPRNVGWENHTFQGSFFGIPHNVAIFIDVFVPHIVSKTQSSNGSSHCDF